MASYPDSVKSFTRKIDNVDKVIAADVNTAYDEIEAVEAQLGAGGITTSVWGSTSFNSSTTSWGTLKARLANIENGVYFINQAVDGGTPTSS